VHSGGTAGHERQLRLLPDAETADPREPDAARFVKARVKVHVYPDGSHALFRGPRCIGSYDEKGRLRQDNPARAA
jgi:hypothetical protein